ncbi:MATE family efflux transporter [Haloferula sargassicola]|uniref:Multidrug-efflux transporter n=1 Tax=Haloferula sargassicola TaxID=490096 RepID=A0ABP9UHK3_9BACT
MSSADLPACTSSLRLAGEARATLRLALPLIVGQLSQMLMGVADTLMIGWVGVTPLAASSFANTLIYLPMMFGIGMSMAVSIRVSQARGAKDPEAARAALRHGLQITIGLGLLTLLLATAMLPFLGIFRQPPEVIAAVPRYFLLVAASMVPAMASMAVKNHADAMNRPWPMFWITLGGVLLNVLLNAVFIFGHLGMPALGLEGAGLATLVARTATFIGMIVWCLRSPELRDWVSYRWFRRPEMKALRDLLRVGFPASMQLLAEVSAFVFATLMIGTLGGAALASHQVAISCAATVFMVPLGLSMALTVRIGEAWGAKEPERMRPILASGWALGLVFTVFSATAFLVFHRPIAGWFIEEPEALSVAAGLLVVAAAFQFSDAMQILSAGALRGLDDVKAPAWIAFGAYWVVSIPLGWVLSFPCGLGAKGVWYGITAGLTLVAIALGRRVWRKTAPSAATPLTANQEG